MNPRRSTTRRLMLAIAAVGLLLGAGVWARRMRARSAECRARAGVHEPQELLRMSIQVDNSH